jgi:hypothetical protein
MKAKWREEQKKKTATGSVNSDWIHYEKLSEFLAKLPKSICIPNARDSSGVVRSVNAGSEEDGVEHVDLEQDEVEKSGENTFPEKDPEASSGKKAAPAAEGPASSIGKTPLRKNSVPSLSCWRQSLASRAKRSRGRESKVQQRLLQVWIGSQKYMPTLQTSLWKSIGTLHETKLTET